MNVKYRPHMMVGGGLAAILVAATALSAFDASSALGEGLGTKGDPKAYALTDFSAVSVKGAAMELEVAKGDYSVRVSEDDGKLDKLDVSVEDGVLTFEDHSGKGLFGSRKRSYHVTISMPSINKLAASGAVEANISGFTEGDFDLAVSGAGEVTLSGACDNLNIGISGAAEVDAKGFHCMTAKVGVSGAGEVSVYASETANIGVSGAGEVNVYGKPKDLTKKVSGVGSVTVK